MSDESQLTLSESVGVNAPEDVYAVVSRIGDAITESMRNRAGDNCATISQHHTDSDNSYVFYIQVPPRTTVITKESIDKQVTDVGISFVQSEVVVSESPPYVQWEFSIEYSADIELVVHIIKPVDSTAETGEGEEVTRELYNQFDFSEFVSQQNETI